jgi:hypothetical protein
MHLPQLRKYRGDTRTIARMDCDALKRGDALADPLQYRFESSYTVDRSVGRRSICRQLPNRAATREAWDVPLLRIMM